MSQDDRAVTPYFVKCTVDSFVYGRDDCTVQNNPVNLSLCKSIRKGRFSWYPDNAGRPSIIFDGCDTEWSYGSEEARDADFERISRNKT